VRAPAGATGKSDGEHQYPEAHRRKRGRTERACEDESRAQPRQEPSEVIRQVPGFLDGTKSSAGSLMGTVRCQRSATPGALRPGPAWFPPDEPPATIASPSMGATTAMVRQIGDRPDHGQPHAGRRAQKARRRVLRGFLQVAMIWCGHGKPFRRCQEDYAQRGQ
jgi:hypothetical protein